jgi:hypothetical protein
MKKVWPPPLPYLLIKHTPLKDNGSGNKDTKRNKRTVNVFSFNNKFIMRRGADSTNFVAATCILITSNELHRSVFEKVILGRLSQDIPLHFLTISSSPYSQKPATGLCPEPDKCSPHIHNILLYYSTTYTKVIPSCYPSN